MPFALTAAILHFGLMDGSAGVAISPDRFITCSDEVNQLMSFPIAAGSHGEMLMDLNTIPAWFGDLQKKKKGKFYELDLEGAARIGDKIYWISSHGFDEEKNESYHHRVFFATTLAPDGKLLPVGGVSRNLLSDLIAEESLKPFQLEAASRISPKVGSDGSKPGGLNIESLCAAADGKSLLIGFRNPSPGGKGLIIPLLNPDELLDGKSKARFGPHQLLDLGGLGLRDMIRWRGQYLILAGHHDSHLGEDGKVASTIPASRIFRWNGQTGEKPEPIDGIDLKGSNPESLILFPDDRVLILSDDGAFQKEKAKKSPDYVPSFRSMWLEEKN